MPSSIMRVTVLECCTVEGYFLFCLLKTDLLTHNLHMLNSVHLMMDFDILRALYTCHHNLILECFHQPTKKPVPLSYYLSAPPLTLFSINRWNQTVCGLLSLVSSLSRMSLRSVVVLAYISTPFFLIDQ